MRTLRTLTTSTGAVLLVAAFVLADEPPRLTLNAVGVSITDAASAIADAADATVLVMPHVQGEVTLDLRDVAVDDAVECLAEACGGSWLRAYLVEPESTPAPDMTAEQLAQDLQVAWRDWLGRRTEEELDAFRQRALDVNGGVPPQIPQMSAGGGALVDAVAMLGGPFHAEQVSLSLQGVPVRDALDGVTLQSGYVALSAPEVEGTASIEVADAAVGDVLADLTEQVGATCRAVYLIGQPQEIPQQQVDQFLGQAMRQGADRFWQVPADQRQQMIREGAQRIADLPPDIVSTIRTSPWAPRILGMAMQFVMTLTPEQRREVMPIMQGFGRLMGP